MKLTIYLAGHSREYEYRKKATDNYGSRLELLDPMIFTPEDVDKCIGETCSHVYIVRRDKKAILSSDIVVAYVEKYTPGTMMEICFSYEHGIPVYVISSQNEILDDPWVLFHSTKQFRTIEDCFEFILDGKGIK